MVRAAVLSFAFVVLALSPRADAAETMRIALAQGLSRVTIEGEALAWGEDTPEASYVQLGRDKVTVRLKGTALSVDGAVLPVETLRLRASGSEAGTLAVDGRKLKGDVVLVRDARGLTAVNVLGLEDYLVGVLGSEMPVSYPKEALRAQAVAARTYALMRKLDQFGQDVHLSASVLSQVYKGLEVEDPRTRDAVEATRGLVLTWQLQPVEAYFSASCGGHTETGRDALNRDRPYLPSVPCPCGTLPQSHWELDLKPADLKALTRGQVSTLTVQDRTRTGRARRVEVGGRSLDAVTFRQKVGYSTIKSLNFEVKPSRGGWKVTGSGFGHGSGMCQWGARLYAERGWDFRRILSHYYPGTEFQTLY